MLKDVEARAQLFGRFAAEAVDDGLIKVIATSNIELILAVLTAYIRGERICDGLWASCVENGVFAAILRRLKELEAL